MSKTIRRRSISVKELEGSPPTQLPTHEELVHALDVLRAFAQIERRAGRLCPVAGDLRSILARLDAVQVVRCTKVDEHGARSVSLATRAGNETLFTEAEFCTFTGSHHGDPVATIGGLALAENAWSEAHRERNARLTGEARDE